MKKILVPTDFSKLSQVAVVFAVNLAKKANAEVIIASVIGSEASDKSLPRWEKLDEELENAANKDAQKLLSEVKSQVDYAAMSYTSLKGYPLAEAIDEYAVANNIDLVVMGTRGASGIKKVVMGSNATAVIDNSSVPVLVVPADGKFHSWKKIVYATDLSNIDGELKPLMRFASLFNADVYLLHVLPENSSKGMREIKAETTGLQKYPNTHLEFAKSDNVAEEVEKYVDELKADLLVTFTHKLDFSEKLLGRSVTRELAFHSHLPLLTFNKSTFGKQS